MKIIGGQFHGMTSFFVSKQYRNVIQKRTETIVQV